MEIVDFSQVLQQSTSGRSLGDEILASAVRAAIVAGSMLQRDVRADTTSVPSACQRWLGQSGNPHFYVGLSDEDAVGFTEVFFGGAVIREPRPLSPVERRVLGTHLAVFLAPISSAVERAITPEQPLFEVQEPPDSAEWLRFGVIFTIDGTSLACTIAARDARAVGGPATSVPLVEDIAVDLEVALRGVRIAWGELATLKAGDIVNCGIAEGEPITAWVGGRVAYLGHVNAIDDELVYETTTTYLERNA